MLHKLQNGNMEALIEDFGALCISLKYKDKEMCLGHPSLAQYVEGSCHIGGIVGRYANRIAGARFQLNGEEYLLDANENGNCLHGGSVSFDGRKWNVEEEGPDFIRLYYDSPDGENGFPGNLRAEVCYKLTENSLTISFGGISDKDTVYGPTSHMYFNLDGSDNILNHSLFIKADSFLRTDENLIPTEIAPVRGPMDFRIPREIIQPYDHCFILKGGLVALIASAGDITLSISTDYPALQLYTGQDLSAEHHPFQGFAAEPEFFPDSPNRPDFPSCVLKAGERFSKYIMYVFRG